MDQVGAHPVRSGAEIVKEESLPSSSNRGEEKHSSKEMEYSRKVYCCEIRRTHACGVNIVCTQESAESAAR